MDQREALLSEIEKFVAERRMAPSTFGRMAVNDGKFVKRLAEGGNITIRTAERVREYIRSAQAA